MLTINSKLLKPKATPGKKIVIHLEIGHSPLPKTLEKPKGKNIAFALDVSGSMSEDILGHRYPGLYQNIQPVKPAPMPQPLPGPAPIWPMFPNPPVNPVNPWKPAPTPHWDPNQNPFWLGQNKPLAPFMNGQAVAQQTQELPRSEITTKIMLAKKALKAAAEVMGEEDTVSLILFNGHTTPLVQSLQMTEANRKILMDKVDTLTANGGTNLHLGWLEAMGCASSNFDKTKINRVMILSDGQTNQGIKDQSQICAQVASFLDKGISTTTFGIGEDFNEVLLQAISEAGGGDFHFIDNGKSFEELFSQELNNVSATVASTLVLGMGPYKHIVSAVNLQEFTQKPNGYLLPNLIRNKKVHATIEIEHAAPMGSNVEVPFIVSYTDMQGIEQHMTHTVLVECVEPAMYDTMPDNKEVLIHMYKIQTAQTTKQAGLFASTGARPEAKAVITAQINALSMFDKDAMKHEITSLQNALHTCEDLSVSNSISGKMLRSQSYDTRYSKF